MATRNLPFSVHNTSRLKQTTPFADVAPDFNSTLSKFVPYTIHPINDTRAFLFDELSVASLDKLEPYLWIAGLTADKIRPLHRQKVVGREIVIAEQASLHLVWYRDKIFIKPIPKCLLHHQFFEQYIAPDIDLRHLAMAFFSTYLMLIRHNSDLMIAVELGLIPSSITWETWLQFAVQLDAALTNPLTNRRVTFHGRYSRGELRLSRLNLITQVFCGRLARGFITLDTNYRTYFSPFLSAVIFAFAYVSTSLAAFQVSMASSNASPQLIVVGYWFGVAVMFVLACLAAGPAAWFVILSVDSLIFAYQRKSR